MNDNDNFVRKEFRWFRGMVIKILLLEIVITIAWYVVELPSTWNIRLIAGAITVIMIVITAFAGFGAINNIDVQRGDFCNQLFQIAIYLLDHSAWSHYVEVTAEHPNRHNAQDLESYARIIGLVSLLLAQLGWRKRADDVYEFADSDLKKVGRKVTEKNRSTWDVLRLNFTRLLRKYE